MFRTILPLHTFMRHCTVDPAPCRQAQYAMECCSCCIRARSDPERPVKPHVKPSSNLRKLLHVFLYSTEHGSRGDMLLFVVSLIAAAACGATFPSFSILVGKAINDLNGSNIRASINRIALYFLYVALGIAAATALQRAASATVAMRVTLRLRRACMEALLHKPIQFFDGAGAIGTTETVPDARAAVTYDADELHRFLVDTAPSMANAAATCIAGLTVGFIKSWQLTMVLLSQLPVIVLCAAAMRAVLASRDSEAHAATSRADAILLEMLSAIRTVYAYNGQAHDTARYGNVILRCQAANVDRAVAVGITTGILFCISLIAFAGSLYYGSTLVVASRHRDSLCYDPTLRGAGCVLGGTVLQVLFAVLTGVLAIAQLVTAIADTSRASTSAKNVLRLLQPTSTPVRINTQPETVVSLPGISLQNVSFAYPGRDQIVLRDVTLHIPWGETVAIVGPSGCGKSTLTALLLRMYDVTSGSIAVDGVNVNSVDVRTLRRMMALVPQDATLFPTSIQNNVRMGWLGLPSSSDTEAESERLHAALQLADAAQFIQTLPAGVETVVCASSGTSGAACALSGGQAQRVAIARAAGRRGRVLILDEGLAALDAHAEKRVLQAICNHRVAGEKATVLMITHRLAAAAAVADRIIVMDSGCIVQAGSHAELLQDMEGRYAQLWRAQHIESAADDATHNSLTHADAHSPAAECDSIASSCNESGPTQVQTDADDGPTAAQAITYTIRRAFEYVQVPNVRINLLCATAVTCVNACVMPAFALLLSRMLRVLFIIDNNELLTDSRRNMGFYIMLGGVGGLALGLQLALCTRLAEGLVGNILRVTVGNLMLQEVGFLEQLDTAPTRVVSRLSGDADTVRTAAAQRGPAIVQNILSLMVAVIISFSQSWRLALVLLGALPLLLLGAVLQSLIAIAAQQHTHRLAGDSASTVAQVQGGIRVIRAYELESHTLTEYEGSLHAHTVGAARTISFIAAASAYAEFVFYGIYALTFYVGGRFILEGRLDFQAMMTVFFVITLACAAAGKAFGYIADMQNALYALQSLFSVIDRRPTTRWPALPSTSNDAISLSMGIQLHNVVLRYPQRPEVRALDSASVFIPAGRMTAVVGESGHGKSSIMAVLERFYDTESGAILVDGRDLHSIPVATWRDAIAYVPQDTMIFSATAAYNVAYGAPGSVKACSSTGDADDADDAVIPAVQTAVKQAHAQSFVEVMPGGVHSHIGGAAGSTISGGQRQRLVVARALMRPNAPLWLLDEVTSALDAESEAAVSATLSALRHGDLPNGTRRTIVLITHRIASAQLADNIIVMQHGRACEHGTHAELMRKRSVYYALAAAQGVA